MARLIWKKNEAPADDVAFELDATSKSIGRDPKCGIFIDAPLISRDHARIDFRDGSHVLVDLGSTNFTKVNGKRITEHALQANDQIHFSRVLCIYEP